MGMKTVLVVIILIVVVAGIGYFGLPFLINKETAGLRADIQDLKQRLQKMEEESKAAPLKTDANVQEVIKTVNAIFHKMNSLESSFQKGMSATNETIKNQKMVTEDSLRKQAETIDKMNKESDARTQKIMFDARMANIRGHVLKARVDIVARNVGTAKNELDLVSESFERTKTTVS